MYRNRTCGELRITDCGTEVTLSGWVQRTRKMGGMTFVDIRDRYGITQVVFNNEINEDLCNNNCCYIFYPQRLPNSLCQYPM